MGTGCRQILALLLLAALLPAQRGDRPGEEQPALPEGWEIPPSPPLAPEEALAAFQVAPGFRVELVAAEPLVEDPIAAVFDPDGRLWVVEMRSYMPDVDGFGEEEPWSRVVVLEDDDGDGRMDRSHVFLDGLVLPRAIALVRDGLLLIEPPYLRFWSDRDGDLEPEDDLILAEGLGGISSPEHAANGLVRALDNWIYFANHPLRLRDSGGRFRLEPSHGGGQWGLAQDDQGRLFFNWNSDHLLAALIPPHYGVRHPHLQPMAGVSVRIAKDQRVRPLRITPGVNRGYQRGILDDEGRLARFTAACGPTIYRGDLFPEDHRGNAFICEPAANLVKRDLVEEQDGILTARDALREGEFLASLDERFRPVNLLNGPDGGLYVVDMYRGVIQHRLFVTSWLRRQVADRELDRPLGLGRIWRIVPEGTETSARPRPRLSQATPAELVEALRHPSGWWRDTAQRLLVERGDLSVAGELRRMVHDDPDPLARLHALWTLEGLGAADPGTIVAALSDLDAGVRTSALRLAEGVLEREAARELAEACLALGSDPSARVRWQLALLMGELDGRACDSLRWVLCERHPEDMILLHAIVSGLEGRELDFLREILGGDPPVATAGCAGKLVQELATVVARSRDPERLAGLVAAASGLRAGHALQASILRGIVKANPSPAPGHARRPLLLPRSPDGLSELAGRAEGELREIARDVLDRLSWPGREGHERWAPVPLTPGEERRVARGRALYASTCAGCHQLSGSGYAGLAPPLLGSEWVWGPEGRLVRIALKGLSGKLLVIDREYDDDMPAFEALSDEDLAAILSYVRQEFGHAAAPVDTATVAALRAATAGRKVPWSAKELLRNR